MTKLGVLVGDTHCLKHLVPGKTKPKNIFKKFKNSWTPWESGVGNGQGVGREKRSSVPFLPASVDWALATPAHKRPPDRGPRPSLAVSVKARSVG